MMMEGKEEALPLQGNHSGDTLQNRRSYGVIEIDKSEPKFKKGFLISSPIFAAAALIFGIILVFGVVVIIRRDDSNPPEGPLAQSAPNSFTDLDTPLGPIRGHIRLSRKGREFTTFYKVPYAKAPMGELRFKDPEPVEPWTELRDFAEVPKQCIQKVKYSSVNEAYGEEDCLYANIYSPNLSANLPVMVYIHGGGFMEGNGSRYGAEYFMDEDVILITFNWRLGPFGFLDTGDSEVTGNMGLKDQVQMLRFVRDHITLFGGDPGRVTIFGNSGGAICVGFHVVSPLSKGLFHRAISQSGAALCGTMQFKLEQNPEMLEELGNITNCSQDGGTKSFVDCLRTKSAEQLALARSRTLSYAMTLEDQNEEGAFMPEVPYKLIESGDINDVEYLIGINNAEWLGQALGLLQFPSVVEELNNNFTGFAERLLFFQGDVEEDKINSVKDFYFGAKEIGNDTLTNLTNLVSDRGMDHCSFATARMHANFADSYLYYLSKPPALSYVEKSSPGFPAEERGYVAHADELQFLFPYDGYPEIPEGDEKYFEFSQYFVKLWVNFAATGNPAMEGKEWNKVISAGSGKDAFWFELNEASRSGQTLEMDDRMELWDQFTHKQLGYDL